jgi:hypothetical protein
MLIGPCALAMAHGDGTRPRGGTFRNLRRLNRRLGRLGHVLSAIDVEAVHGIIDDDTKACAGLYKERLEWLRR